MMKRRNLKNICRRWRYYHYCKEQYNQSAIYRGNKIYKDILSGNLIAIRVNKNIINPYYLKAFIDSKVGALALRSIQTGTSIITITVNGLKEMKYPYYQKKIKKQSGKNIKLIQKT